MKGSTGHNLNRKGFTLAEVLIVVTIVLIIVGVSIPVFTIFYKKYQMKHIKDLETAAKAAAVAAFYTGYDNKNNKVDISQTGVCTFLYDAENNSVYVMNDYVQAADFKSEYATSVDRYGLKIDASTDYSDDVIIIWFDGRYYRKTSQNDYYSYNNYSKGTFEEPSITMMWKPFF